MGILDFLVDSEGLFIKKYGGTFNLNEFLNNSINKLGHIEMLFTKEKISHKDWLEPTMCERANV